MTDKPEAPQHPDAFVYRAGVGLVSKQGGTPAVDGDLFMRGQDVTLLMHRQGQVIDTMEQVIADLRRQLAGSQEDRNAQYDMKVRAREQRDRMMKHLAELTAGQKPVATVCGHHGLNEALIEFQTENNEPLPVGTELFAGPTDQGEPDVILRIIHQDGEVVTPVEVSTSRAFDELPEGEVSLYLSAGKREAMKPLVVKLPTTGLARGPYKEAIDVCRAAIVAAGGQVEE
jgi:hypothetical protein